MKKYTVSIIVLCALLVMPVATHASTLTQGQVSALVALLQAFGVDSHTIDIVEKQLSPILLVVQVQPTSTPVVTPINQVFSPVTTQGVEPVAKAVPEVPMPTCTIAQTGNIQTVKGTQYATVAWGSENAYKGIIKNNHVLYDSRNDYGILIPEGSVQSGIHGLEVSDEQGTVDTITATFTGDGGVATCSTDITVTW